MPRRFTSGMECPLTEQEQNWIDERWKWLSEQFGAEFPRERPVILPTPEYFPNTFPSSPATIDSLFESVCRYMNIDPASVVLEMAELEERIEGLYVERPDGLFHICIANRNRDELQAFVGTAAHELAHIHLLGHQRLSRDTDDHELVTDLLPIFFGMGIFGANSVIYEKNLTTMWQAGKRGYMSMAMHSYALAKLAYERNEPYPKWAKFLRPDVRAEMRRFNSVLFGKSAITNDPVDTDLDGEAPVSLPQEEDAEVEESDSEEFDIDAKKLLQQYAAGERDFHNLSFRELQLTGLELPGCDFTDCDFTLACCDHANFSDGNFTGADFRGASLVNAVLLRCDLKEAVFASSNLNGADLAESNLSDTDFRGAQLVGTKIIGTKRTIATDFRYADISQLVSDGNIAEEVKKTERHVDGGSKLGDFAQRFAVSMFIAMCLGVVATSLVNLVTPSRVSTSLVGAITFFVVLIYRCIRKA